MLVSQEGFEEVQQGSRSSFFDFERLSDGWNNQIGVADGSKWDETDAIGEVIEQLGRDLQTQAGFADAAGAGEGHEAHVGEAQEGTGCCYLLLAPN